MRRGLGWIGLAWAAACCLVLLATPAWAGDCASPDDCGYIPDNGTKAACAGGVLAGCVLYERSRKKKDKDEEGEGVSTDDDSLFGGGGGQDKQPSKPADSAEGTGESADNSSLFGGGGGGGAPGGPAPRPPVDPGALGE